MNINDRDLIKLKSGKTIYVNRGLVSVNWEDHYGEIRVALCDGYDSDINLKEYGEDNEYHPAYTKEELIDLAEQMIARWNRFIEEVKSGKIETKD